MGHSTKFRHSFNGGVRRKGGGLAFMSALVFLSCGTEPSSRLTPDLRAKAPTSQPENQKVGRVGTGQPAQRLRPYPFTG